MWPLASPRLVLSAQQPQGKSKSFFLDNFHKSLRAVSHWPRLGHVPSLNQSLMPKICSSLIGQA